MTANAAEMPKIIPVGDGFYVRQEVDNIAWMDLGECGLVVDALERPELEDEVFAAIVETLGETPIRYVLNTHTHYDHVALNQAFVDRCDAEIVNQETSPLGEEGRWFAGPRRKAHMVAMGGCHTPQDCVVWVEPDRALFVGDLFGWGLIPVGTLTDESATRLLGFYQRMIDFDAETVIPGHGPLCSTGELKRWVEYFHWLVAQAKRGIAAGHRDAEIISQTPVPPDMQGWWRLAEWKHAGSLAKVLHGLRSGRLTG